MGSNPTLSATNTRVCRNVHVAQAVLVVPLCLLLFHVFGEVGILLAIDGLLIPGSLLMLNSLRTSFGSREAPVFGDRHAVA